MNVTDSISSRDYLSPERESEVAWGVFGCALSIPTIIILSSHLLYHYWKDKPHTLMNSALFWQLVGFCCLLITCTSNAFLQSNIFLGGVDNPFDYHPVASEPYSWAMVFICYFAGKLSTDISWIIRVHATFKVQFGNINIKL